MSFHRTAATQDSYVEDWVYDDVIEDCHTWRGFEDQTTENCGEGELLGL